MKKLFIFLAVLASLSIFRTASAQTPSPTINGTPPPFTFTGPGVSQTGQTFTFTGTGTGLGSITWSLPAYMTASPGTITTAGTQTFSFNTETANTVFAGPSSGSAAAPTFRALVNADIPTTLTGITIDGVTPTVMGYVDPTSSIQTQLNGKQCTLTLTTTGTSGASTLVSCVLNIPQYSGGGGTPGGSSGQFQYNNSSSFGGVADLTYSTHTISGISTTIFDLSAATGTAAFKVPVHASNTATASGVIDFDSTANHYHVYDSGADDILCTHNNGECGAGSGNMNDGSGTTTVGDFPETTSTAHVYSLNTPATVLTQLGAAPALTCTTVSSLAPANNGCYYLSTSASAAMPSGFTAFTLNTGSGVTATFTGVTVVSDPGCSGYVSGSTLALTGNQAITVKSDGTNVWATCTAASGSSGTVTSVSVTTANGVSGSVATATTTPAITLTLGAITPTSTNGVSAATMAFVDPTSSIQTQLNGKQASGTYVTPTTLNNGSLPGLFSILGANTEYSNGTCTTSKTITPVNGNMQNVTLTNGDTCALTFTQPSSGTTSITLKVIQSTTSTFNGTISGCKWPGGTVPTITATTGAIDFVSVYLDGTNAYCAALQNFH